MGNNFKQKVGVKDSGIHDVERVFHTWLDPAVALHKLKTSVEGNSTLQLQQQPLDCFQFIHHF